jgi:hypothetical protein
MVRGGFGFHPSDEDLSPHPESPGTPEGKSHLRAFVSEYSNWRIAIVHRSAIKGFENQTGLERGRSSAGSGGSRERSRFIRRQKCKLKG